MGQIKSKSNTLQMALSNIHGYFLPCDIYIYGASVERRSHAYTTLELLCSKRGISE